MAIIMITHDLGVVAEVADDVVVMYGGQVVEQAPVGRDLLPPAPSLHVGPARLASASRRRGRAGSSRFPGSLRRCCARPTAAGSTRAARTRWTSAARRCPPLEPSPGTDVASPAVLARRRDEAPRGHERSSRWSTRPHREEALVSDLLVVENVKKYFPITRGIVFQKQVAAVKAVDDVSFTVKRGETLGIVGESGLRQVDAGALHPSPPRPDGRPDHLRRSRHHVAQARRDAADPPRDDDGVPGPVRLAQPAQAGRLHRRRAARGRRSSGRRPSASAGSRSCSRSSASTPSTTTGSRTSSRAGSASGSASPARSPSTPSSSSATSPCRRSTSPCRRRS